MQQFSSSISLIKNSRGVYDIDTIKGCYSGMRINKKGCYGACYANRILKQYGYEFEKPILRKFNDFEHLGLIRSKLLNLDMPFIRIGVFGDPSENWKHTIDIIRLIFGCIDIVLITKHWKYLTNKQLSELSKYGVIINTSISALDSNSQIKDRLIQYNRIKDYCKSVLRIVSCKFNLSNLKGLIKNDIQSFLFENDNIIDTVFRCSKNNELVISDVIKLNTISFNGGKCLGSKFNNSTYTGSCDKCPDMCGIN